jgi:FAD/FMN-containing dehydrogenase
VEGVGSFDFSNTKWCFSSSWNQVPIVPYGGATSIEGHTLAPHGGVCIDLSSMKVNIKLYNKDTGKL